MDLHHMCVAETLVAVPCCRLLFMTYIFRHCGLLILKIISIQAHRNIERESVHVLIHLHYSKIIVFVVLLSFCVILTR